VRELADGLIALGHRPSLITSHPGRPTRIVEDGLPVLRLPRPPQRRLLRRGYEPYLTHVPLSYLGLLAGNYDLAHAIYPADALAAGRWSHRTGRPAVFSYMGIPDRRGLLEYRSRLRTMQEAVRQSAAVVALSSYAADAFDNWLDVQARVIPPPVDVATFAPAAARAPEPTIVCSGAADVPRKNVGLLVRALGVVRREHPRARLVLSRPRDLQAARDAGVDVDAAGIEWRDLDASRDLARAYSEAWVAALPSASEAFGLVLVEAMACGTPVVGYRHGAIPEVIDDPGVGVMFDRLEPEALADSLLTALALAEDPNTGQRCREHAARFSRERCTQRYVDLYREVLSADRLAA
jgi:phosphatidylinositol alpha-mannosyltransferase